MRGGHLQEVPTIVIWLETFGILENCSLRRGGLLWEVVATGSLTVCWHFCSLRSKRFHGVGEQRRDFRRFARAKNGARAKKRKDGEGKGKEGNACRQTPGFWKPPTWPFMSECAHVVIGCQNFRGLVKICPKQRAHGKEKSRWIRATNAVSEIAISK